MTKQLADALQHMGVPRVESLLIAYMKENSVGTTKDIVAATDLRQPEVSIGMRQLRERGWMDSEPIPREGKGRPMNKYTLSVAKSAMAKHYQAQGQDRVKSMQTAMADALAQLK